jgi:hypothetical protein
MAAMHGRLLNEENLAQDMSAGCVPRQFSSFLRCRFRPHVLRAALVGNSVESPDTNCWGTLHPQIAQISQIGICEICVICGLLLAAV